MFFQTCNKPVLCVFTTPSHKPTKLESQDPAESAPISGVLHQCCQLVPDPISGHLAYCSFVIAVHVLHHVSSALHDMDSILQLVGVVDSVLQSVGIVDSVLQS